MNPKKQITWAEFKIRFREALDVTDPAGILAAWGGSKTRTEFYGKLLAGHFKKSAGLVLEEGKSSDLILEDREFLRVDFVVSNIDNPSIHVPQIWIESENACLTAFHEIRKLCSLQGLKILLTVIALDETQKWDGAKPGYPESWPKRPEDLLLDWQKIVDTFAGNNMFCGQLGILIGERTPEDRLRFYELELRPGITPTIADVKVLWELPVLLRQN